MSVDGQVKIQYNQIQRATMSVRLKICLICTQHKLAKVQCPRRSGILSGGSFLGWHFVRTPFQTDALHRMHPAVKNSSIFDEVMTQPWQLFTLPTVRPSTCRFPFQTTPLRVTPRNWRD